MTPSARSFVIARESTGEVAGSPRFQQLKLHLQQPRRDLCLFQLERLRWNSWIREHGHAGDSGNRLLEQLQPLADQLRRESGHSSDVSPRPRQAGHEPTPDRIVMIRHDDGDRRRGAPGRLGSGCGARDYDVHLEPNKLVHEGGESVGSFPVPSTLDEDVLAVDVPQFTQPLEESLPGEPTPRAVRRGTPEKAYPIEFPGLLRLGRERRNDEAERENKREPDQPHGHLGVRMAGGESSQTLRRAPAVRQAEQIALQPNPVV
jgi:hypothetical protein